MYIVNLQKKNYLCSFKSTYSLHAVVKWAGLLDLSCLNTHALGIKKKLMVDILCRPLQQQKKSYRWGQGQDILCTSYFTILRIAVASLLLSAVETNFFCCHRSYGLFYNKANRKWNENGLQKKKKNLKTKWKRINISRIYSLRWMHTQNTNIISNWKKASGSSNSRAAAKTYFCKNCLSHQKSPVTINLTFS